MYYRQYSRKLLLSLLLCFFLVQCSSNSTPPKQEYTRTLDEIPQHVQELANVSVFPGDAEPAYSIELIQVQPYGKTGEPYLTKIQDCVVDDKGRVIIYDSKPYSDAFPFLYKVHAYNADGTYHTQIGGQGRGPGEYGMILFLQAKAGKVYLYDYTGQRINVYTTDDYSFEQTSLIERWGIRDQEDLQGLKFGGFEARNDGNLLVLFYEFTMGTARSTGKYLLMDIDGNRLNFEPFPMRGNLKMGVQSTPPKPSTTLPFMGKTVTALSGEDVMYSAWTQDFLIKTYDAGGTYHSAIYYPVQGSSFDLSDYTEEAGYDKSDVSSALDEVGEELPESNPVIADMEVDDKNRIWVAVPTGLQGDSYEWWILEESGQLLAKLMLPRHQPIYDIRNGYLYSKKTNEETGAEYAVKYRIELTEK